MSELPKAYDPAEVEPRWYAFWEQHGVFRASLEPGDRMTIAFRLAPEREIVVEAEVRGPGGGHAAH